MLRKSVNGNRQKISYTTYTNILHSNFRIFGASRRLSDFQLRLLLKQSTLLLASYFSPRSYACKISGVGTFTAGELERRCFYIKVGNRLERLVITFYGVTISINAGNYPYFCFHRAFRRSFSLPSHLCHIAHV